MMLKISELTKERMRNLCNYLAFQRRKRIENVPKKNDYGLFFPVIPIRSFNGGIGLKVRMKAVKAVYLGW